MVIERLEGREKVNIHKVANKLNEVLDILEDLILSKERDIKTIKTELEKLKGGKQKQNDL